MLGATFRNDQLVGEDHRVARLRVVNGPFPDTSRRKHGPFHFYLPQEIGIDLVDRFGLRCIGFAIVGANFHFLQ
jgi:hypothetical protein